MTTFGIDVSIWQQGTGINWAQVVQSGIKFAVARASIGRNIDGSFKANFKGMKEAGILPGAYHYLYHGNGAGQARTFLSQVGDPEGALCLDVEYKEVVYDDVKAGIFAPWYQIPIFVDKTVILISIYIKLLTYSFLQAITKCLKRQLIQFLTHRNVSSGTAHDEAVPQVT